MREIRAPAHLFRVAGVVALTLVAVTGPAAAVPQEAIVGLRTPAHAVRVLRLPDAGVSGDGVAVGLARLRARPGVAWAKPDWIAHAAGSFDPPDPGAANPPDPRASDPPDPRAVDSFAVTSAQSTTFTPVASAPGFFYPDDPGLVHHAQGWEQAQWNLMPFTGVDAPQAWANLLRDHRAGGRGVTIAVLDSGVAYRNWHRFRRDPDFGRTRFVDPYDFVAHNRFPLDRYGHGTFVAAAIAESTNNAIGLTGLAYGASIMPLRVLDAKGNGDETAIAKAIRYAVDHGASIINMSFEFLPSQVRTGADIPEIVSAIDYARRRGVMLVAAAGNDEIESVAYPADATGVVSVGATTRDRCLADYSNSGAGLALVAPGGGDDAIMPSDLDCHPERFLPPVYQLTLADPPHWGRFGYPRYYIGTSMAAPEVAGAAALVIASRVLGPHPTSGQVLTRLEQTATPLPAGASSPNVRYGYGLLDVGAATAPLNAAQHRALRLAPAPTLRRAG